MVTRIILLFAIISTSIKAQEVGFTFGPAKNALGVIYIQDVYKDISLVASTDFGTYIHEFDRVSVWKSGGGLKYKWFTALYQYNKLYNTNHLDYFNLDKVRKNSLEIGCIGDFTDKVGIVMLFDAINGEGRIGVTFKLK